MTEESAPGVEFGAERHTSKIAAVHVGNSIMARQTFIEKCVIGIQ